ncbi:YSIRK-type signal peptide-containing protein, partial [Gemella haemolysans]
MFSKNNTKMNNKKQYEKVNHYGIKKFNAGTASVLIASAFMFLGGAAQAADTNKQEATVAATEKATATEEKAEVAKAETPAVAPKTAEVKEVAPKAEVKEETTVKAEETKAEKATAKEVNKTALQAKISQLDNLFVTLAGQELSEDKQVKTVSAAVELNKAKDLVAQASATQEQVDAQVAALESAINNLSKVEKTADKKEEAKKEEKSEKAVAKENLEKAVSEAKAVNQAATTFETKQVKEEAKKAEIKAAVATSEKEIEKALDIFNSDSSTKEDADQQRKELEKAIEAVYVTMQRAGHRGKVESILADAATQDKKITGKDILKDGETVNAVTNAYVDMNADNTKPVGWGFDTTISTSTLKAGSITKIELTNLAELGAGLAVNTEIRATDGTVVGKVKSIDYKTTTGNNNNKSTPYWGQRTQRGMTYDQRLAEQPAVANETGTYTYNIEWNDKVKDYPNVSFGASNLSGNGYYAPEISKDTPYTATIKIDGRTVLEHTYTRKGQQANYQKQGTSASLSENNGLTYLNNEQTGRSDSIVLKTDSDVRYGVGSKFTIKLPNADFTEFKELEGSSNFVNGLNTASTINPNKGDSITYRPASRWANVKANENNVWILNDGRDSGFTLTPRLISPTELELTVTEGAIQEGSVVSMPLQSLGIEKVIKDKTLTSEYSNITYENGLIKQGYVGNDKTAATLTVSGGESVNGEKEDVITKVPNGWSIVGDGKVQGEPPTGAVVRTFKDLVTGEVIGFEPTRYTGNIPLSEDGSKDYTNVLGNKYDVSNDNVDLVKEVNGEEYILADLPAENAKGTLSVTKTRARDLYSEEELKAKGINGSAFVTPAEYNYVKKTKVEEVNRTIKFVYADNVADLAGTEVFPSQKQTVSYTGSIKLTAEGKAVINSNDRPVYINWKGTNGQSTDLPELAVPQKEGYIASVEKVPVQATTATDEDYEYVVKYTAIQKAKTTFVDEKGNAIPGVAEITEQGGSETPLTKEAEVKAKIKELEKKGYELVSNTYPENGAFDKDKDKDQEFVVTLKAKVVTVTPDQPKTPGTPVDPNNPEGPKYPAGLEEKDLNKTVTRTITYV